MCPVASARGISCHSPVLNAACTFMQAWPQATSIPGPQRGCRNNRTHSHCTNANSSAHPLFPYDAQVSGHLYAFTPYAPRRVPTYCSSFAPVANSHIWPNPSRLAPLVGALVPRSPLPPGIEIKELYTFIRKVKGLAASQAGREGKGLCACPYFFPSDAA